MGTLCLVVSLRASVAKACSSCILACWKTQLPSQALLLPYHIFCQSFWMSWHCMPAWWRNRNAGPMYFTQHQARAYRGNVSRIQTLHVNDQIRWVIHKLYVCGAGSVSTSSYTQTPFISYIYINAFHHEIPKCRLLIRSLVLVVQPIQEIMTLAMSILDLQCWSKIGLF